MLVLLLLTFCQEGGPPKADVSGIKSRIVEIDTRLQQFQTKLDALDKDSRTLSDEVNRLELERALLTAEMQMHELQLQ